jgi:hypothetical protein
VIKKKELCINKMKKRSFLFKTGAAKRGLSLIVFSFLMLAFQQVDAQRMSGQWIGGFTSADDPSGSTTDYVLEIEVAGTQVSGYSYTYFSMSGKRYFVICRLKGSFDKGSKSLSVNEVETVKTNTPPDFKNCHQSHELTYLKQADKEILLGKWKPVEKGSDCGKGNTSLERKLLITTPPSAKKDEKTPAKKTETNTIQQKIEGEADSKVIPSIKKPIEDKTNTLPKGGQQSLTEKIADKKPDPKPVMPMEGGKARNLTETAKEKLTQRNAQVIKTIDVTGPSIKIDIYDNGQVDGDTVSIFMNGVLLIPAKMLTAKPITINIDVNDKEDVYDIVMFAESMGTIPPNTALMVVTTATNRYEINITSTEQTSGSIRLKIKR